MIIIHETEFGGEYHVRVRLNETDIEGIASTMHSSADDVDGKLVAQFLRRVVIDALGSDSSTPPGGPR